WAGARAGRELLGTVLWAAARAHRRLRADAAAAGRQAHRVDRHQGLRVMTDRWRYLIFALWVIGLASTPFWATNYIVRLAIMIAMYTSLTLSWNFIGGFTGSPSFSTAAFFGLGCYAGALSQRAGVPMVLAWVVATVFVGAFAAALGAIILRLRGHYFPIGSLGVGGGGGVGGGVRG